MSVKKWTEQRKFGIEMYWSPIFGLCDTLDQNVGQTIGELVLKHVEGFSEETPYELCVDYKAHCENETNSFDTPGYYDEEIEILVVYLEVGYHPNGQLYYVEITPELQDELTIRIYEDERN